MVKQNIIILGINDGHDAGAALIKNGQVMAAVQEERLNNIKHFAGIPEKSILEVFKIAKVDPGEVNLISMVSFDPPGIENLKSSYYKIIKTFELTTGIGAILNTSFNLHGYPIVGTPQTALWTLENSKIDGLILGNYLVMNY